MPVLSKGSLKIDYTDDGQGQAVILVHSSVSGNRQWRSLTEALKDRYRVLAINLFGYGETTPWPETSSQSLHAQAQLILSLCEEVDGPVHLVGHSVGGSVALKAALLLGPRLEKLILLEPNPFFLLKQRGRTEAFLETWNLYEHVKYFGSSGDWPKAAQRFADYWNGEGSWKAMPEKRRAAFVAAIMPSFHEWDAVMNEETTIEAWSALTAETLVVCDRTTPLPIREIVDLFAEACPQWSYRFINHFGHMAPLTHPEVINPMVCEFLDSEITLCVAGAGANLK
jgi:pimeloyl-ACP methyl ester carboxylesterase